MGAGTGFLRLFVAAMVIAMVLAVLATAVFCFLVVVLVLIVLVVLIVLFHNILLIDIKQRRTPLNGSLFSYAFKRQMQIDVALFCFAKRTSFPSLGSNVHITTFATNPKNGRFAFIKRTVFHAVAKV